MTAKSMQDSSYISRLRNNAERCLPVWIKIIYYKLAQHFSWVPKNQSLILSGRLVRRLRSEIERNKITLTFGAVATNCGLIRIGEEYIGVFKNGTFNCCWEMGLNAHVDSNKGIRQKLYIARFNNMLRLRDVAPLIVETIGLAEFDPEQDLIEDARLIHNCKEIVLMTNYVPGGGKKGAWPIQTNAWPLIGVLNLTNNATSLHPLRLNGIHPPQKNWIPFSRGVETFLQYSIVPHRILRVDPRTGHCDDAWLTHTSYEIVDGKNDFKGGAPLIVIGDQMLGACHSWALNKNGVREYFTYLYLTQVAPPFELIQMSPPLKILLPGRIQYLVGMVLNVSKDCVTMSYGVNDCDNYFVEIPLKQILGLFQANGQT